MCGRLSPGPAGTRLPRITFCPVTRVAPFSHLHKPIAISLHLASRSVTAVTRESLTGRWTKNVRRNTNTGKKECVPESDSANGRHFGLGKAI